MYVLTTKNETKVAAAHRRRRTTVGRGLSSNLAQLYRVSTTVLLFRSVRVFNLGANTTLERLMPCCLSCLTRFVVSSVKLENY